MQTQDSQRAPELDETLLRREAEPAPVPARRRIPPSLVARYEDIRFAGEGAMGTVYRAVDPRLGRPVAL